MDGFGEVFGGDRVVAGEVGDGAGDAEEAVVSAGREAEFAHGHFEGAFAGGIEAGHAAELRTGSLGIEKATG